MVENGSHEDLRYWQRKYIDNLLFLTVYLIACDEEVEKTITEPWRIGPSETYGTSYFPKKKVLTMEERSVQDKECYYSHTYWGTHPLKQEGMMLESQ